MTPSELKHVMNSLGEKAQMRADPTIAWRFLATSRQRASVPAQTNLIPAPSLGGHKRGDRRDGQRG